MNFKLISLMTFILCPSLSLQLSCMWEDVRWLRQSMSVSMSSSSTLQARHKMLTAAGQLQVRFNQLFLILRVNVWTAFRRVNLCIYLQNLLGTHNLGRVHYEPIKDRHGNVLLVTIRDLETQHSLFSGKWMQVTKLQSQRKSLSTPEEPYALDILIITMQVRKDKNPNLSWSSRYFQSSFRFVGRGKCPGDSIKSRLTSSSLVGSVLQMK